MKTWDCTCLILLSNTYLSDYLLSSWIREGKTLPPLPSASSLCAPSKLLLCRNLEEDFGFAIKILTHPATVSYIQVCWLWGDSSLWMSPNAQHKWNRFASVMTHTIPIWNTTLSTVRTNWVVEKEQGECFVNFFTKRFGLSTGCQWWIVPAALVAEPVPGSYWFCRWSLRVSHKS
jgi:hypothetical protein